MAITMAPISACSTCSGLDLSFVCLRNAACPLTRFLFCAVALGGTVALPNRAWHYGG